MNKILLLLQKRSSPVRFAAVSFLFFSSELYFHKSQRLQNARRLKQVKNSYKKKVFFFFFEVTSHTKASLSYSLAESETRLTEQ